MSSIMFAAGAMTLRMPSPARWYLPTGALATPISTGLSTTESRDGLYNHGEESKVKARANALQARGAGSLDAIHARSCGGQGQGRATEDPLPHSNDPAAVTTRAMRGGRAGLFLHRGRRPGVGYLQRGGNTVKAPQRSNAG